MKPYFILLSFLMMLFAPSCKKNAPSNPDRNPISIDLPSKADEVIASSNRFGIDLFRVTALEETENMMLSPLSASTALTMLLNGCGTATYEQIRDMLGYEGLTLEEINSAYQSLVYQLLVIDPDVKLALANAVFYRQDFEVKLPYLDAMNESFEAEIAALDFSSPAALEAINNWASDNTNGKIPEVLNKIDPMAVMFLMNALYFKGTWTTQFNPDNTQDGSFTLSDGSDIAVQMMKENIPVKMFATNGATAIELDYGHGNFAMILIIPDNSLSAFLQDFNPDVWNQVTTGIDAISEPSEIEFMIPRFRFEYEKKLNDQLQAMGMVDAFDEGLADLSGISESEIYVDFVKQNTFVEVNEEGTEAAAVTTIGINYTGYEGFIVNKPFIFIIRERTTNAMLFIGKVEKPEYN